MLSKINVTRPSTQMNSTSDNEWKSKLTKMMTCKAGFSSDGFGPLMDMRPLKARVSQAPSVK